MEIDNFKLIKTHLTFVPVEERWLDKNGKQMSELRHYDRYVIHVLRRPKDCKELVNELGSNESQRLIKTYFIDNLEYFDKKVTAIKELCKANNARAYILLQVRNTRDCLLNLSNKITEVLLKKNYGIKPERLLRQAYCDYHSSRKPVWMLDIDNDQTYGWTQESILEMLRSNLAACGKNADDMYVVPTKNGYHVITEPFNTLAAEKACQMVYAEHRKGYDIKRVEAWLDNARSRNVGIMFQAEHKQALQHSPFDVKDLKMYVELMLDKNAVADFDKSCKVDIAGWLHKDAATLLYAP